MESRPGDRGNVLILIGFLICLVGLGGCASNRLLTVDDRLCRPGDRVTLTGKLEWPAFLVWNKGLEDRDLDFFFDGTAIGRDDTDEEGYASVKHRVEESGVYPFRVVYTEDGRHFATCAEVYVWPKDAPIMIVDIDDTLARTQQLQLFGSHPDRSDPIPGAQPVVEELAKHFRIVYLTARPREIVVKTRAWLDRHGFPRGPVLTWDVDQHEWSLSGYKRREIDRLQEDFSNIRIGIGNSEEDHEAYRKRKLFTILIDKEMTPGLIWRGVVLPDWSAIQSFLNSNPQLYGEDFDYDDPVTFPQDLLEKPGRR
ncbi:MAG: hypothetical protein GXY33_05885 [Phycisphaerae bacterium]|nr:hypothetical protein [Phycisphaerae bacterium]